MTHNKVLENGENHFLSKYIHVVLDKYPWNLIVKILFTLQTLCFYSLVMWCFFNANSFYIDSFTATHHASLKGSSEVVMGLIELECDVNAKDKKGDFDILM